MSETESNAEWSGETLTLEKLQETMRRFSAIPPAPMLAQSHLFPSDHAMQFTHDGREFVCASEPFWRRFAGSFANYVVDRHLTIANPLFMTGLEIVDIDLESRRKERAEVLFALISVMSAHNDIDAKRPAR